MQPDKPLIETKTLRKYFPVTRGLLRRQHGVVKALDGVSLSIEHGETFTVVGESGCGKTTLSRLLLQLEQPTEGTILWEGENLATLGSKQRSEYRQSVQAVFQDPWSSLNPRMRVRDIVAEPLMLNQRLSKRETTERVLEILAAVGLQARHASLYAHEFSGGQRQRIAIARALILRPKIVVLDEPVSMLDVSIRAQIMNLLKDLQASQGLTYMMIAHDFGTVRYMGSHTIVMYLGKIVEQSRTRDMFHKPRHPYTQALIAASMPFRPGDGTIPIARGEISSPLNPPSGCRYHVRCPLATEHCRQVEPLLEEVAPGHFRACHVT